LRRGGQKKGRKKSTGVLEFPEISCSLTEDYGGNWIVGEGFGRRKVHNPGTEGGGADLQGLFNYQSELLINFKKSWLESKHDREGSHEMWRTTEGSVKKRWNCQRGGGETEQREGWRKSRGGEGHVLKKFLTSFADGIHRGI